MDQELIPDVIKVLKKTKEKIATTDTWVRGWNALNVYGKPVSARDPTACKWCVNGALSTAIYTSINDAYKRNIIYYNIIGLLATLEEKTHSIIFLNDNYGFEAVHEFLDFVIAKLENDINI